MRLIDAFTLELCEFPSHPPRYAILSHTWGDEEVSFQEFTSPDPPVNKNGYTKIVQSCALLGAEKANQKFMWIDTCCIDKSSSAELSESINSMFNWYRDATVCYAYLEDVSGTDSMEAFRGSRWFKRGWTLQELIAPVHVEFLSKEWKSLGSRRDLASEISNITSIDARLLLRTSLHLDFGLHDFSVATRMSWAAGRKTTRVEDVAYCLMGIFNINMPLLYGEGQKAFLRLQEEIVKAYNDQSILAWHSEDWDDDRFSPFAPNPDAFEGSVDISFPDVGISMSLDTTGLALDLQLMQIPTGDDGPYDLFAILQGHLVSDYLVRPMIQLEEIPGVLGMFRRTSRSLVYLLEPPVLDGNNHMYVSELRDRSARFSVDRLVQIDRIETKRIILPSLGGRQYMTWAFLPPPLNITTANFCPDKLGLVYIKMAIPSITAEHRSSRDDCVPLKSEPTIIQRHTDMFPIFKPEESLCLCGALYFVLPGDSFILFWGFRPETQLMHEVFSQQLSRVTGSPFVFLRKSKDIYEEQHDIVPIDSETELFRHMISMWLRGPFEYGSDRPRGKDLKDSATLDVGLGSVSVSASIKRVSFLDRSRYHLTVEVRVPEGVKYRRTFRYTRPHSRFATVWD
ncbi:Heterokaryon incompatibility protein (HET) domain containing protein [Naviculisporaceae sp. PSN 640]